LAWFVYNNKYQKSYTVNDDLDKEVQKKAQQFLEKEILIKLGKCSRTKKPFFF